MIGPPEALVRFVEPWATLYADSALVTTAVVFSHVAALMLAGGLAITMDRGTLRATRDGRLRSAHLDALAAAHRVVVPGLALSVASGLLLFTADLEALYGSPVFWTKLVVVALLLANGFAMTRVEAALRAPDANVDRGWGRLALTARASLVLWFATALAGVTLVNAG